MDATAFAHSPASAAPIFGGCLSEDGAATVRPSEMVVVAGVRRTGWSVACADRRGGRRRNIRTDTMRTGTL